MIFRADDMPYLRNPDDIVISKVSEVKAPPHIVFEVITDFRYFTELEKGVKSVQITAGTELGKGTRSHWVLEDQSTGETWELDEEIVRYDPPRSYAYVGYAGGKDYSGVHTLTENSDGSTRHLFREAFYFDVDVKIYDEVIAGLMSNVKREAERRACLRRQHG